MERSNSCASKRKQRFYNVKKPEVCSNAYISPEESQLSFQAHGKEL